MTCALRSRFRLRSSAAAAATLLGCLIAGCSSESPEVANLTQGVWAGDGGPDTFLFELDGTPPDSLFGTVHVMRDGRMDSELAITRASYRPPDIEMFIESTGARYEGSVDAARGRIQGSLSFDGQSGPDMDLRWVDPTELPGFAARAEDTPYTYVRPPQGIDGWQTATPEDVGLDRGALERLVNAVARGEAGLIHSLHVVRGGKLVLDEHFHGYGPDDLHRLASTTKSISSLLVGIAIDRGLIPGVNEPLLPLLGLSEDGTGRWSEETLADLLTMTMGLDWTAKETDAVHGTGPAFFRQVLHRQVVAVPGTKWEYASANVNLLAGVIFRATGQQADTFAQEALFEPLGITAHDWTYGKEGGYVLMDGSLHLRPRDLAKVGAMVAAGGAWNGRQVISREWIRESTASHVATGQLPALNGYGYLWWTGELQSSRGLQPVVVANGRGSQFIVILPGLDMVVVTTGGNDDNGRHLDFGGVLTETLLASLS
ncbi:MAG: serine hydrolase [Gemmatimonadota bacterium]